MLTLYGQELRSRLLLGTARYPSPASLEDAVRSSATEVVTVSLRRGTAGGKQGGAFFELIRALGVRVLPNTAGCHSVSEAVLTARMAREVFGIQSVAVRNYDPRRQDLLETFDLPRACVLVFGQEGPGLTPEMLAACDAVVEIAQFGSTRSINAGAAAAIAMHAWVRRHRFGQLPGPA